MNFRLAISGVLIRLLTERHLKCLSRHELACYIILLYMDSRRNNGDTMLR